MYKVAVIGDDHAGTGNRGCRFQSTRGNNLDRTEWQARADPVIECAASGLIHSDNSSAEVVCEPDRDFADTLYDASALYSRARTIENHKRLATSRSVPRNQFLKAPVPFHRNEKAGIHLANLEAELAYDIRTLRRVIGGPGRPAAATEEEVHQAAKS
jgi:hypothetical protein